MKVRLGRLAELARLGWLTGDYSPLATRTVLQMEAVECGAASLAMILAHYGRHIPLEELRTACGVSRDGSKASNIVKAARKLGLKAKGLSADPVELKAMPGPTIVFWNFNHFVVLEGFARGRAWINDPARGRRSVPEAEFDASFTGVVLVFEKDDGFVAGGNPPQALLPLLQRIRHAGDGFRLLLIASFMLTIPGLVIPAFSRLFVDYYLVQKFEDWLDALIIGLVLTAILRGVITALQQQTLRRLQARLSLSWSARFFWHVLRLPLGFFQQRFGGEIASRVAINDQLAGLVGGEFAMVAAQLLSAVVFLFVMLQYSVWVTVAVLLIGALNLALLWWNRIRTSEANQRLQMDQGKFIGAVLQGAQQMESLKAAGAEQLLFQRWMGFHTKVINAEQSLGRRRLLANAMPRLSAGVITALVLLIGGWEVMRGNITLGMLVALQALAAALNGPLMGLIGIGARIQEAEASLRRLDDVLNHPLAPEFSPARTQATTDRLRIAGRVTLRGVSFGYSPLDPPLIQGFDLDIQPGERVAVVGASGSGKSTVGKLVAGLNLPWSGDVLLDGLPLEAWPRDLLRRAVAMVDQDISLFEGAIMDNLTLWNPTMPEGWCIRAAKDAAIHGPISSREGAYGHPVKEGGRNFSVGERQRIEIARALVGQPSVLVLDEATSALDPALELHVMESVRRRGITCLVIAHRLSTVRDCDRIVVMHRGRMVESGAHAELMARGGYYKRLVEA
jgi:NHLM bacteriocin system ABC transporter peptidase/ATP-binding protein